VVGVDVEPSWRNAAWSARLRDLAGRQDKVDLCVVVVVVVVV
jgi:hypothetical protein